SLEQHPFLQSVVIDGRDDRTLLRETCLLLDDRRQRHDVVARHAELLESSIPLGLPDFLELRDEHADGLFGGGAFRERIRVGKEVALERRRWNVKAMAQRRVTRGGDDGFWWD